MKFVLALSVVAVHATTMPYDCPVGKQVNSSSTTLTEAGCCISYAITCKADMCTAPLVKVVDYADVKADCCAPKTCFTPVNFACPIGKELVGDGVAFDAVTEEQIGGLASASTVVDNATCCVTFVPTCGKVDQVVTFTYQNMELHPFDCKTPQIFKLAAFLSTDPSPTKCCENFTARCNFVSGSLLSPIPFSCGPGKKIKDNFGTTVDSATCCEAFVPTCGQFNAAGDPYKCSTGKTLNGDSAASQNVTDAACCKIATCGNFKEVSGCGDITCNDGSTNNQLPWGRTKSDCCEIREDKKFSGATHAVPVLAVFSSLFL